MTPLTPEQWEVFAVAFALPSILIAFALLGRLLAWAERKMKG